MKNKLPNTQPPYSHSRSNNASNEDSLKTSLAPTNRNGNRNGKQQEQEQDQDQGQELGEEKENTDNSINQRNTYKSSSQLADVVPQSFRDMSFDNQPFLNSGVATLSEQKNNNIKRQPNNKGIKKNNDRQNNYISENNSNSTSSKNQSRSQQADLGDNDCNEYNDNDTSGTHSGNKSKKRLYNTNSADYFADKKHKTSNFSQSSPVLHKTDSPDVAPKKGRKLRKNYTLPPKPSKDDATYFMDMRKYRAAKEYLNNLSSTSLKQVAIKHKISVPTLITYMDSERVKQFIKTGKYSGNAALKAKRNDKNQYNEHSQSNEQLLLKTKKRIAMLEKFKNNIDLVEYLKAHEDYDEQDPVFKLQKKFTENDTGTLRNEKSNANELENESDLEFDQHVLMETPMHHSTSTFHEEPNALTSAQLKSRPTNHSSRGRQLREQIEHYDTPIFPNNEKYELSDDDEVDNQHKYTVETFRKQTMNTEEKVSSIKKIINDMTVNSSSNVRPIVPQVIHYAATFDPTKNEQKNDTSIKTIFEKPTTMLNSSASLPKLRSSQNLSKTPSTKPIKFKPFISDESASQSSKSHLKKTEGGKSRKSQPASRNKAAGPLQASTMDKNFNSSISELPASSSVPAVDEKVQTQNHQNNNHVPLCNSPTESFVHPYTTHAQQQTPSNVQARVLNSQPQFQNSQQKQVFMNRDPTYFTGPGFVDQYGQPASQNPFPFGFSNFDYPNPVLPGVINGRDAYNTSYPGNTNQNNLLFSNANVELRPPFQEAEAGPPLLHYPQQNSPHHPYNSHVYFPNHFDLKSPPAAPPVSASLQQYQAAISQQVVRSEMGSPPYKKDFGSPTQQGYMPASSRLNKLDTLPESAFQPFNDPVSDPEFSNKYNAIFDEFQKKFRDLLDGRSEDLQIYYARQMEQKMSTVFYPYSLESILKSRDHPQLISKPNSRHSAHEFAPYIYQNATASSGYSVLDDMKNNTNATHGKMEQRTNVPTLSKIPFAEPNTSQHWGRTALFSPNSLNQYPGSTISKASFHYKKTSPMKKQKEVPETLNLNKNTPKKSTSKKTPFLSPPNTTTTSKNPDLSAPQLTPEGKKTH